MAGTKQRKYRSRWQGGGVSFHWAKGAGANINTNIAIADGNSVGIQMGDEIIMAVHRTAGVFTTDLLAQISITSAGNVQNTTTDTTGDEVEVMWLHIEK